MADKLLIEKLLLLESRLRKYQAYKMLEPFRFNPRDVTEVQSAAKKIAGHLGLDNMTFIISYATQKKNTAGHIQLDNSNDVFIEIDSDINQDHEAVLSILAHEICHKYLFKYNIKLFPDYENEILTDTATIFTGLGKLTLNGCEKTHISISNNIDGSKTETRNTKKLGYLDKSQFALLYKICCTIHQTDQNIALSNLSPNAKNEIQNILPRANAFLNNKYFKKDFYFESFKDDLKDSQTKIAIFQRNARTAQHVILPHCFEAIEQYNKLIYTKFNLINDKFKHLEDASSLTYISNMVMMDEYANFKKEVIALEDSLARLMRTIDKFNDFIVHNSADIQHTLSTATSFLQVFQCPNCKKEMKISPKKLARVSCAQCNHNFIIDTGHEREKTTSQPKKKAGILDRIKSVFKNN